MGIDCEAWRGGPVFGEGLLDEHIFEPLTAALKSITADDEGKKSLKEKVKKVVIHATEDAAASNYAEGLSFQDGVLTINWRPYTNAQDQKDRTEILMKFLESKL